MENAMTDDPFEEFGKPASDAQSGDTILEDDENIFGDVDINEVSDDPFEVGEGTYHCICSDAKITTKGVDGDVMADRWFKLVWTVEDPENEYDKMPIREQFKMPPRGYKYEDMDAKQKQALKFFKQRLRQGFDFSETQLSTFKPSDCLGSEAMITVVHNPGKGDNIGRTFVNVRSALAMRIYEERQTKTSGASEAAKSVGL